MKKNISINSEITGRKLIAFLNSYSEAISGGDACFIELAKRMDFEMTVVTSQLGKKLCEEKGLGANYLITTREKNFKNVIFIYLKRIIKALFLRLNVSDEDVLYSTSDFLPDVLPAFYQKLRNKKVFWIQKTFHLIPSNRFVSHYAQKISFFFIKRLADLTIVDNHMLKETLLQKGFSREKLAVNFPGIDAPYLKKIKKPQDVHYDAAFLGRYHPSKGVFDLIKIWKLVCEKKPSAKLALIGGGNKQIKEKLRTSIFGASLVNNIDLLGFQEEDKAFEILKSSKLFVFPSREEGFGIALLEAMACELPVVAWDLPVYAEIFPKGVVKIPLGKIEKFADAILQLSEDTKLRENMVKDSNGITEQYNWDNIVSKELALINSLADAVDFETSEAI